MRLGPAVRFWEWRGCIACRVRRLTKARATEKQSTKDEHQMRLLGWRVAASGLQLLGSGGAGWGASRVAELSSEGNCRKWSDPGSAAAGLAGPAKLAAAKRADVLPGSRHNARDVSAGHIALLHG